MLYFGNKKYPFKKGGKTPAGQCVFLTLLRNPMDLRNLQGIVNLTFQNKTKKGKKKGKRDSQKKKMPNLNNVKTRNK